MEHEVHDEYYIVRRDALPAVFVKVAEARRLLETGAVHSASEAARCVGISRSAYYKYKDMILPYENTGESRVLTIQSVLRDQPGVLSALLAAFFDAGANILTVNQNIPVNGAAFVTVAARTDSMAIHPSDLMERLRHIDGVVSASAIGVNY